MGEISHVIKLKGENLGRRRDSEEERVMGMNMFEIYQYRSENVIMKPNIMYNEYVLVKTK